MSSSPSTQAHSFHLDAPLSRVLPLFTAQGERDWAPGWDPELLSGDVERGSAFRTRTLHDQETIWVVTEFRPQEGRVSYARVALGSNIGLVDVVCTEPAGGGTDVSVRYTLTALSEQGRIFVRDFMDTKHYVQMIDEWRAATSASLAKTRAVR